MKKLLDVYDRSAVAAERLSVANQFFSILLADDFLEQPLSFSPATHPDTLSQQLYYWAAEYFYDTQDYERALNYGLRAEPLCEAGGITPLLSDCLNLIAITYIRLGNSPNAARYAKLCYQTAQKLGDPDALSSVLNTLAGIYIGANLPKEAEQYVLRGIDYCRQAGNQGRLSILYGMASEVYHAMGRQEQALDYARKGLEIEQQLGRKDKEAIRLTQMAEALTGLARFSEAREALEKAIPQLQQDQNYQSLGIACNKMGELLLNDDQPQQARPYFDVARQIFSQMGDPYNELHAQLGLYNCLKDSLPQEAMPHLERYNTLRDTIYARSVADSMAMMGAQLGNDRLRQEKDAAHTRARIILYVSVGVVSLLLLVLAGLFIVLHQRTRRFERQFNELSANADLLTDPSDDGDNPSAADGPQQPLGEAPPAEKLAPEDRQFVERVNALVRRQIKEGRIDVSDIAREMAMSMTAFRRRFTDLLGDSPQAYIIRLRMERARQLFDEHPELNISEVAMKCGFDDKSNFTRAFKHVHGMTPSDYVRQQK
ncbi:MAG: helix-turn-helix domain-containing protein [Prevotella sp.]|nr:helix-turn-helix domain-containing protein [Prevotella sp.]MBQ9668087.1 helix-turn-helix domain-containing protein [Prevotella sp.]